MAILNIETITRGEFTAAQTFSDLEEFNILTTAVKFDGGIFTALIEYTGCTDNNMAVHNFEFRNVPDHIKFECAQKMVNNSLGGLLYLLKEYASYKEL